MASETVTGTVLTAGIGGVGFCHAFEITCEYQAATTATLSFVAADTGNGSYAPAPITLPATNGNITKFTTKVSPNKWKLLQWQFQSNDPILQVNLEGSAMAIKTWGSQGVYENVNPFSGSSGGYGAQP